jgi:hypothetical protein
MVQTWVAQKTLKRNILRVFSMSDLINSLTPKPKSVLAGTNNSRSKGFWLANTRLTNIPTMMEPFFPSSGMVLLAESTPPPGTTAEGVGQGHLQWFSIKFKLKDKFIYFYPPLCILKQSFARHRQW